MPLVTRTADRLERGLLGEPVTSEELTELVRLAHSLPPATRLVPGPSADFVSRLGVQLREEAARLPVVARSPTPTKASPARAPARRTTTVPTVLKLGGRGLRLGIAGLAVVAVLLSGLGVASRSAVPGSLLYPVKELLDRVAVGLAGSHYDTGMTYLGQAQGHVSDARKLTASHAEIGPVDIALTSAITDVQAAQREFVLDYASTKADRDVLAMRDFATQVLPQLDVLRPSILPAARPTLDQLIALLRPYAAGAGLPATLPGDGVRISPTGTLPGAQPTGPTSGTPGSATSGHGQPGASGSTGSTGPGGSSSGGLPGIPGGPTLPVNPPSSPGVSVSLPGATVTVGPTGGGVVVTPTIGPIKPTVSITIPPVTSLLPTTLPPILPTTLPALPTALPTAPFKVGDTVKILSGINKNLTGTVTKVDTTKKLVTVKLLVLTVTLPYGALAKV